MNKRSLELAPLVAIGMSAFALSGCAEQNQQSERAQPSAPVTYDISPEFCDNAEADIIANDAVAKKQELTAEVLVGGKDESIHALGKEIGVINPIILSCDGAIKYIAGLYRGFTGADFAVVESQPIKGARFKIENFEEHTSKLVPYSKLDQYKKKVQLHDEGPIAGGVSGLTSDKPRRGIGMIP